MWERTTKAIDRLKGVMMAGAALGINAGSLTVDFKEVGLQGSTANVEEAPRTLLLPMCGWWPSF